MRCTEGRERGGGVLLLTFSSLASLLVKSAVAMCPVGCNCSTDDTHVVRCDGAPLFDVPSLLDPRTKVLTLSKCGIRKLDADVLEFYPDLEYLDLSRNEMLSLDSGLFRYQGSLRTLLLNDNAINVLQRGSFLGLTNLKRLDLSGNRLSVLEEYGVQELGQLELLNLSNNSISEIPPKSLSGLSSLTTFIASSNRIRRLGVRIFEDAARLETLTLADNLIASISREQFSRQSSLRFLDLSSNLLTSLEDTSLYGLSSLHRLDLSNNIIHTISVDAFRHVPTLVELDLSWNSFSELPASMFQGLFAMQRLVLTHQQNLRVVHANAFRGVTSLRELNISSCRTLEAIHESAFERSSQLRSLDLSYCGLTRLPPALLDWTKLAVLRVAGNPFHCDNELLSFLPSLLRTFSTGNVLCASPPALAKQNIATLERGLSLSDSEMALLTVCGVLLFLSIASISLCWLCRRQLCVVPSPSSPRAKIRTPIYERSILIAGAAPYDKTVDLLTASLHHQQFYSPSELSASTVSTTEDCEHYSTLIGPYETREHQVIYERPPPLPMPTHFVDTSSIRRPLLYTSTLTVPPAKPPLSVNSNDYCKVVAECSVPVTKI